MCVVFYFILFLLFFYIVSVWDPCWGPRWIKDASKTCRTAAFEAWSLPPLVHLLSTNPANTLCQCVFMLWPDWRWLCSVYESCLLLLFPELNNGLSSTEELSLYPENGYVRYSHGGLSRWPEQPQLQTWVWRQRSDTSSFIRVLICWAHITFKSWQLKVFHLWPVAYFS